jgi:hypothetical protein
MSGDPLAASGAEPPLLNCWTGAGAGVGVGAGAA